MVDGGDWSFNEALIGEDDEHEAKKYSICFVLRLISATFACKTKKYAKQANRILEVCHSREFIVGSLVVVVFVEYSVVSRIQLDLQIDDLEDEISSYRQRNADNVRRLNELKRNPTAIEKIAREQYFMKADNEDIYVLSDDKKAPDPNDNLSETGDND